MLAWRVKSTSQINTDFTYFLWMKSIFRITLQKLSFWIPTLKSTCCSGGAANPNVCLVAVLKVSRYFVFLQLMYGISKKGILFTTRCSEYLVSILSYDYHGPHYHIIFSLPFQNTRGRSQDLGLIDKTLEDDWLEVTTIMIMNDFPSLITAVLVRSSPGFLGGVT